jgi:hypothetical protein
VPRRVSYVPQHRGSLPEATPKRPLHALLTLTGVAAAAIGLAVSSGVVTRGDASGGASAAPVSTSARSASGAELLAAVAGRSTGTPAVSRSMQRSPVDATKAKALDQASGGQVTATENVTRRDPRTIAKAMLAGSGFGADQFSCLDSIYASESGWNVHADNPSSSAYGIPQALPGSKMSSAGADWHDNAATQIKWGLGYIKARYGSPCSALSFRQGHGWY